jgi:hypothetical protein
LIFTFCIYYKRTLKLPKWAVTGLIGLCFGFALMILAPGNYVRAALVAKQNVKSRDYQYLKLSGQTYRI